MGEDTRIEDRRKAFTKHMKEAHPERSDDVIAASVERQIADSIASPQTGSQPWMNRPAGLTVEQYRDLADKLKALYTPEEIAWLSTQEAVNEYKADPIAYLVKYTRALII